MRFRFVFFTISFFVSLLWNIQDITQLTKSYESPVKHGQNYLAFRQSSATISKLIYVQKVGFSPNSAYKKKSIHSFSVWINQDVFEHKQESEEMLKELDWQLLQITRVVPPKPLSGLRKVRIWVEWEKQNGAAEFHPSAEWLRQNGYNPDKAGCIEISNTRNFVNWSRTDQPWMVLHEMAHAYHFIILGNLYPGIDAAYQHAIDNRLYEYVDYIKGGKRRAYALTNAKEYFAELSEAYFGKNDFYPYTRIQLKKYDPVGYQLMEKTWGTPQGGSQKSLNFRIWDLDNWKLATGNNFNNHQSPITNYLGIT